VKSRSTKCDRALCVLFLFLSLVYSRRERADGIFLFFIYLLWRKRVDEEKKIVISSAAAAPSHDHLFSPSYASESRQDASLENHPSSESDEGSMSDDKSLSLSLSESEEDNSRRTAPSIVARLVLVDFYERVIVSVCSLACLLFVSFEE
jgi:hypothetical protein